jgi:site-specific DNA recombinase
MATAYIYLRVSTEDQVNSGLGLEAQQKACLEFAQAQGLDVGHVFIESGVSRWVLPSERPAMASLMASLKRGDIVIALKIDRVGDAGPLALFNHALRRKGCQLLLVQGDNSGSLDSLLMQELSAVLASHECRQSAKRARSERWTRRVFGYQVTADGLMVECPTEQDVIARMVEWRQDGWSLRDIVNELEALGIAPPSGRCWYAKSVANILNRQGTPTASTASSMVGV